jgi:hypothetical protein
MYDAPIEILVPEEACFFQLVSNLFCVVKRGFVEPCKNVLFVVNNLVYVGWRSADFLQVFLPKMFAGPAQTYLF